MNTEHDNTPKQHNRLIAAGGAAAILLLGLGAFALLPQAANVNANPQNAPAMTVAEKAPAPRMVAAATPRLLENGAPFSFADLVERVAPAVVTVTVEENVSPAVAQFNPADLPEPFRDFFNQFGGQGQGGQGLGGPGGRQFAQPHKAVSMGSGFIIDKSGLIVTNNHVVENAKKITVKLKDGREYTAKLIGTDQATDVALVKVKSDTPLPNVEFGDDRQARVGDWVIAVGNPFGLSNTVTAGIISSIGRDVGNGPYTDYIQIDAPINRGNSGGPTFDIQGKVIGMNSMIYSPSGGSVGIGFAIPASTIHDVVAQLQAHGRVARGWLGVQIQSVTPELAASLGSKESKGAIIANTVPGGPAAKAGFVQGDIVLAVNGKSVEDSRDLSRRVALLPAGATASFTVIHDGSQKTLQAKIGVRKEEKEASNAPPQQDNPAGTGQAMGLTLSAVTDDLRRTFSLDQGVNGVVITKVDPNSDAADKGLEPGEVVVAVANKSVRTPQDIKSRISEAHAAGRKSVLVLVSGENGERFVALNIGS
ncbi:MAG TPA: Do family serine endopeptidase [Rhizomicrobium sp.]|nr:Do family serine endopeptidase [Rhizomicrobium sp.]